MKRMRVFCVVIAVFLSSSCGGAPSLTAETVKVANAFLDSLSILKNSLALYNSYVSESVSPAKNDLYSVDNKNEDVKIKLPQVASDWEKRWQKVDAQTTILEKRFADVGSTSKKYWDKLNEVSAAVRDETLRKKELSKNEIVKAKWEASYAKAKEQIKKSQDLREKGHDFHKILLGAALRQQITEYIETLNTIAEEASNLTKELETLTDQGQVLING